MKTCKIVCGFPGVGKTYAFEHQKELGVKIMDSDSSKFSKITQEDGTIIQNPDFPKNYIDHIYQALCNFEAEYILVSSHADVRRALWEADILYSLVFPIKELKDSYMEAYKKRGSPEQFINFMDENFDKFVDSCLNDIGAIERIYMDHPEDNLFDWIKGDIAWFEALKKIRNDTTSKEDSHASEDSGEN